VAAVIVVRELLENAYQHAGGPHQLRIHHENTPCEVAVAVADIGAGEPACGSRPRRGRGLILVNQLCTA
jgi:anti-sigma regulatory factor (Ser/Thr protein kinase)